MTDAIQTTGSYLKCDACEYVTVNLERDLTKEDVGSLCPKCGADMLTQSDFETYVGYMGAIAAINKASELIGIDASGPRLHVRVHNHNGKTTIEAGKEVSR